jgi:hypothetical protein
MCRHGDGEWSSFARRWCRSISFMLCLLVFGFWLTKLILDLTSIDCGGIGRRCQWHQPFLSLICTLVWGMLTITRLDRCCALCVRHKVVSHRPGSNEPSEVRPVDGVELDDASDWAPEVMSQEDEDDEGAGLMSGDDENKSGNSVRSNSVEANGGQNDLHEVVISDSSAPAVSRAASSTAVDDSKRLHAGDMAGIGSTSMMSSMSSERNSIGNQSIAGPPSASSPSSMDENVSSLCPCRITNIGGVISCSCVVPGSLPPICQQVCGGLRSLCGHKGNPFDTPLGILEEEEKKSEAKQAYLMAAISALLLILTLLVVPGRTFFVTFTTIQVIAVMWLFIYVMVWSLTMSLALMARGYMLVVVAGNTDDSCVSFTQPILFITFYFLGHFYNRCNSITTSA